jgi:hypothetical protein
VSLIQMGFASTHFSSHLKLPLLLQTIYNGH